MVRSVFSNARQRPVDAIQLFYCVNENLIYCVYQYLFLFIIYYIKYTLKIIIFIYAVLYFVFIIFIKRGKNIENIQIPFYALFSKKLL